jgi:TatD DNase family protein
MYQDAHNHLQHAALRPYLAEILSTIRALPVNFMVVNGTAESDWEKVAKMAKELSFVIPSFGLHPWFLAERSENWEERLRTHLTQKSCAIGEVGLDLWMQNSDLQLQKKILKTHMELATEFQRPITIHCLRAWSELLELLPTVPIPDCGFLLHSYSGPARMIEKFLPFGSYFSFSGYFLNRGKEEKAQTFREIPYDRLLVETDAPDMPLPAQRDQFPLPNAAGPGSPNHPANIRAVVRGLAEILNTPEDEVLRTVRQNFYRLFENVIPATDRCQEQVATNERTPAADSLEGRRSRRPGYWGEHSSSLGVGEAPGGASASPPKFIRRLGQR